MATDAAPTLDDLYDAAGHKYNIDPLRIKAHAIQETGEKADVPSSDGKSWGFGQFKPETWKWIMPGVPLSARGDPQTAIEAMARLLAQNDDAHRDQYGNVDLLASTAAYNGSGPAADAYAKKIQAIHGRLVTDGGLHLRGGPGGQGKPAANDDDAFSQTLKGQPAGPADKPAADDAFSQTLKGGPAKPAEAQPSAMAKPEPVYDSEGHPVSDTEGPADVIKRDIAALPEPIKRIGGAMADAWNAPNPLMTPELQRMIEGGSGPGHYVGNYITSPLLRLGGWAMGGAGALTAGGLAAANEVVGGGPLGRDVAQMLQLTPEVQRTGGLAGQTALPQAGPRNALAPGVDRPYLTPEASADIAASRPNLLRADANETSPTGVPQFGGGPQMAERPPSPGMGGPQPQAAGAAATDPARAEMSMAEFKANRKQGELNAIMEPNAPGPDTKTYVEGSVPTRAEHSNEPAISQQETLLRERDPDAYTKPGSGRLWLNNEARVRQFEDDMGSAPAREAINQDLKELAQREQPLVLRGATSLDLTKAAEVLNSIVNDPRQSEVDAVRKVIAPLRDALYDANGKLKSDPLSGWGMIDNIRNKIENAGLETSQERHVVSQLMAAKGALTDAMNQATGGRFGDYLGRQAALLQQRNAMDVLQKFRPQLTNAKGDIQFAAFHRWMLGLARQRGAPGADPAMAIPDSTMQKLIGIDKDLKRAQNIDLGKGRGSQTNLLFSLSKSMGLGLVHAAVHGGVAAMGGGGVGNLLAQSALSTGATKINALNLKRHVRRSLAPPPAGENWLNGP